MSAIEPRAAVNAQGGFISATTLISLLFIAVLAVLGWVGFGITAADRWPIEWLEVKGRFERVSAERVRASLQPLTETSYFTLDLDAVRDAASGIHWVANVKVRKQWPDTVVVSIVEHKPVAHWNDDSLISAEGRIFSVPEAGSLQGLPWLWGSEQQFETVIDRWVAFNRDLAPFGLEISDLRLDKRLSWEMTLSNNTRIHLGRDAPQQRLERLLDSWQALLSDRTAAPVSIDLRYTNGFAVNWHSTEQPVEDGGAGADS